VVLSSTRLHWPKLYAKGGLPGPLLTCMRKSLFRRIHRCAIRRVRGSASGEDRCRLYPHFASAAKITRLSIDPEKGMAGRCVQGLTDVLEGNYGGDITQMPYVVNKEAFRGNRLLASKEKWRDRKLALTSRFRRLSLRLQHPNGLLGPMILKRLLCCAYLSVLALAFSHTSSAQNSLNSYPRPRK